MQQVVVVSATGSGSSRIVDFLLGFPASRLLEKQGMGRRRPLVIEQVKDSSCQDVTYEVKFAKDKDARDGQSFANVNQVAEKIADANDPGKYPQYFDCLEKDPGMRHIDVFDAEPIYVTMKQKAFAFPLRLVNLPALPSPDCDQAYEVAKKYLQPGNVCIANIGTSLSQVHHLLENFYSNILKDMINCEQTLFVANGAEQILQQGHAHELEEELEKVMLQHFRGSPNVYLLECGRAHPEGPAMAKLWKEGIDQQDWPKILHESGCQAVQEAMYSHDQKWANNLRRYDATRGFGLGVKDIFATIYPEVLWPLKDPAVSQDGPTDTWSVEQAAGPWKILPDILCQYKLKHGTTGSVTQAVAALNKGDLVMPEGLCVVLSTSQDKHYLLYRSDKKDDATRLAGLVAGSQTWLVGEEIEAQTAKHTNGVWYPAEITSDRGDGNFNIKWLDDKFIPTSVTAEEMRKKAC